MKVKYQDKNSIVLKGTQENQNNLNIIPQTICDIPEINFYREGNSFVYTPGIASFHGICDNSFASRDALR